MVRLGKVVLLTLSLLAVTMVGANAQSEFNVAMQSPQTPSAEAPLPAQGGTTVFFDFDTSDLNEEARELISMIVEEPRNTDGISVHVTGHSSTAHSDPGTSEARQYNVELSLSRAEAVKAELVRLGVNANAITIEGVGSVEPLVETGPGVIEPMNRRAVIELLRP